MTITSYHAFTDELDEYVATLEEAHKVIEEWKKDGYENLRIYQLTSEYGQDDEVEEIYMYGEGDYPW